MTVTEECATEVMQSSDVLSSSVVIAKTEKTAEMARNVSRLTTALRDFVDAMDTELEEQHAAEMREAEHRTKHQ